MKSQDLRIGNLIKTRERNPCLADAIPVTAELLLDIAVMERRNIPVPYDPIPLTEEWLTELGVRQFGMNKFEHIETGWDLSCSYDLRYVHQIQNLCFALTNCELEWKSKWR